MHNTETPVPESGVSAYNFEVNLKLIGILCAHAEEKTRPGARADISTERTDGHFA